MADLVYGIREQSLATFKSRLGGFSLIGEAPQMDVLPVGFDLGNPLLVSLAPRDPSVLRCRVGPAGFVLPIAVLRNDAQVSSTVVESDSVDVIDFANVFRSEAKQGPMQPKAVFAANSVALSTEVPSPLVDPVGVSCVNGCPSAHGTITAAKGNADCPLRVSIIQVHQVPPALGVAPRDGRTSPGHLRASILPDLGT